MTATEPEALPRWDVSDVHESFTARSFLDAASSMKGLEVDREPLGTTRLPETRRG